MDIGTAKPTRLERRRVVHHMIDLVDPEDDFSVSDFKKIGRKLLLDSGRRCVIVGGSGLHFRALVDPMNFAHTDADLRAELYKQAPEALITELVEADPGAAAVVDLSNHRRVVRAVEILRLGGGSPTVRHNSDEAARLRRYESEIPFRAFGVDPGEELERRIDDRLSEMPSGGLVAEVRGLIGRLGRNASTAVGYREILAAEGGELPHEEAFEMIRRNTRKLARRQRTWFQRDPRIRWIPWETDPMQSVRRIEESLD